MGKIAAWSGFRCRHTREACTHIRRFGPPARSIDGKSISRGISLRIDLGQSHQDDGMTGPGRRSEIRPGLPRWIIVSKDRSPILRYVQFATRCRQIASGDELTMARNITGTYTSGLNLTNAGDNPIGIASGGNI